MALITSDIALEDIPAMLFTELRAGTVKKKHPFRNVVLSTVKDGAPQSRWVVFRKWTDQEQCLIYTDHRSAKVTELRANPSCSLLFHHPRQGLQIRIDGKAHIHLQDELTEQFWPGVKGSGAKDYTTHLAPGTPIARPTESQTRIEQLRNDHFAIIRVVPERMDVLQLGRDGHIRADFRRDGRGWQGRYLVA